MDFDTNAESQKLLSRRISIGIALAAIALGLVALYRANHHPRTEDAEIFANFIGIAPQVDGPLIRLNVRDNEFVKKGDLLYEIDERPYQYALETAVSEQAALEGQIGDEKRRIAALVSAVSVRKRISIAPRLNWQMQNRASAGHERSGPMQVTICIALNRY
jgi:multidrug efflux system membrane fusion protein